MFIVSKITSSFKSEKAGGLVLVTVTLISLLLANSVVQEEYIGIWHYAVAGHSITHWINDGLMTIFFLLVGLELEREIYKGELSNIRTAALPIFGAIGGIVVPSAIYLFLNYGTDTQSGAGIPMATDIAFAIGILSLLGSRVPLTLKIFLTALAVIDDLGAILVIAIFYTDGISWGNLFVSLGILGILILFNKLKVKYLIIYLIGGVLMWYFMLNSGVHATITGVLLAFAIPFGNGDNKSSSYVVQKALHKPIAFFVLPIFAMANTCIAIGYNWQDGLLELNSLGIFAGLVIGKPLGIFLFAFLGVVLGFCTLPTDVKWKHVISVGFLGGIGFTMSIFVTLLAFRQHTYIDSSKIAVLLASTIAGTIGYILLSTTLKKRNHNY